MSEKAKKDDLVRPIVVELTGAEIIGGSSRIELGQLVGSMAARFNAGDGGSPERALTTWTVRCPPGTELTATASHQRAGSKTATITC